jgi:regulatory protein
LRDFLNDPKSYALKLLSYRSRSRKEIIDRLKRKDFPVAEIEKTIHFLEKAGFISDEALIKELFRYSVERKALGKKGVEAFLTKRGIDKELIHKELSGYTKDIEAESAARFAEKKLKSLNKYPKEIIRRRIWGMLQRRGFSAEVISKALEEL